ncbi:uncharacterized protein [Dermacentor albipictus]|uniref:uncharacterized protein n=1 Tax=Dermacentor albipictus TaxID=60249 RepID=UPI0031FCB500
MEAFLETVRDYPCLYDKSNADFKDKDLRANRWHIIGQQFGMTGEQAAGKFKNFRDRWLKVAVEKNKAYKSGAPGKDGKAKTEWTYYYILDSFLRKTPYYAEKLTTNIPMPQDGHLQQAEEALPTTSAAGDCWPSLSPAEEVLDEICSGRTPVLNSEDEESCSLLSPTPTEAAASSGSNGATNRAQPPAQLPQVRLSSTAQSR